jgi:hypothetical protein
MDPKRDSNQRVRGKFKENNRGKGLENRKTTHRKL